MPPTLLPRSLALAGEDLPLFSGALHYFRVPQRRWAACLQAVASLGFPIVETYVPWGVHEEAPGRMRWDGDRDLGAFLDAAAAEGLKVLLRPGPAINAELTFFGFPERIVRDEAMLARSARGTPVVLPVPPRAFPVPSYASRKFLDEVRGWFAAVAEVVAPRLWPRGPVVGLQVDNELGYFFRAGAFDGDYHPDAVARWHALHPGQEPPRRLGTTPAEIALALSWLEFKEQLLVGALSHLSVLLEEVGLGGVVRFHNFPPVEPGVADVPAAEGAVDFAGLDLYHLRRDYDRVRRRSLYLAGSSRLPYVPETGAGSFAWGPPFGDADMETMLLGALMHGVAGANLYMLVERDRWYGSPISNAGEVRPSARRLQKILAALREADWTGLEREADVGLLIPRGYGRLALAASHLGPIGPAIAEWIGLDDEASAREATLGFEGPIQLEQARWREALTSSLTRLHVPFVVVDASAPLELLRRRKLLLVPTFDFLDVGLAERLREFSDGGGQLVTGPRQPRLDAAMQQFTGGALPGDRFDPALLADEVALDAFVRARLEAVRATRPAIALEPSVDTAVHVRSDGRPSLLFVGTRSAAPITATIELTEPAHLEDALTGERFFSGPSLSLPLEPHSIRLLRYFT